MLALDKVRYEYEHEWFEFDLNVADGDIVALMGPVVRVNPPCSVWSRDLLNRQRQHQGQSAVGAWFSALSTPFFDALSGAQPVCPSYRA